MQKQKGCRICLLSKYREGFLKKEFCSLCKKLCKIEEFTRVSMKSRKKRNWKIILPKDMMPYNKFPSYSNYLGRQF